MDSFAFFTSQDEESNLLKMRTHRSLGSSEPNLHALSVCSCQYSIYRLHAVEIIYLTVCDLCRGHASLKLVNEVHLNKIFVYQIELEILNVVL